jgi:uncharacterized protein (DUF697 family)
MAVTFEEATDNARSLVNKWTAGAAAVSWVPGSTLVLGFADYAMIRAVAEAYGVDTYDKEAVVGVITAASSGKLAVELLSFIPVFGWIAKAGIAAGITKAVGEAVINYFQERSPYRGVQRV